MSSKQLILLMLCGIVAVTACSRAKRPATAGAAGPGWVGIECQVRPGVADRTGGLLVVGVDTNGPGQRAGILPGDVMLSFGRSKLGNSDPGALTRLAAETAPGTLVPVVLQRDGRTIQIRLAVAPKPAAVTPAGIPPPPSTTARPVPPPPPPSKPVREQDIVFPK